METHDLIDLVVKIQKYKCEFQNIELKSAHKGCPTRLFDTLSSFSNQDSGGVIVFGIEENANFDIVGVYDPQDLQKKITEQCKQMEPTVRPLFTVIYIEGNPVVSAEIPSAQIHDRPVFYKGVGRVKGSYIRVGESDEQMSEYEVYSYEAYKRKINDELVHFPKNDFTDFNEDYMALFLAKLRTKKPNLTNISDEKNLALSGIFSEGELTLTGLMMFGTYPQALFPQLCITAVVIPGYEMGETGDEGERFLDNKRIEGTIPQMLDGAMSFFARNMREKTIIDENGRRADKSEYPIKALREIVLNALIHRDYSRHTESSPIRIMMYKDRVEVENPGGLYGRLTLDNLGKVGADTRNPYLASNLEVMIDTENRFSGIPTIRNEMKKALLKPPVFENIRGIFKVILYNNQWKKEVRYDDESVNVTVRERVSSYCETPRSREELIKFTGFSRYYTLSKIVAPLVEKGVLEMTIPNLPRSRSQKFQTKFKNKNLD